MARAARALVALLVAASAAGAAAAESTPARGHLVIIGGGERPPYLMRKIVELGGGREARLLILPMASIEPRETARFQKRQLEEAGAGRVDYLLFDRETADRRKHLRQLRRATGVFLSGGDQRRLADVLDGTQVLREIRALYQRGGVVAGTSAGAAVMSSLMITGDERKNDDPDQAFETIQADNMDTRPGFGLLPASIVDQHFVRRRRHNRLLSLVLEHPSLLGIGIDEGTAVVVGPPDRFQVLGESLVVVYDGAKMGPVSTDARGNLAAGNLVLHLLRSGQRFRLDTREPEP